MNVSVNLLMSFYRQSGNCEVSAPGTVPWTFSRSWRCHYPSHPVQ